MQIFVEPAEIETFEQSLLVFLDVRWSLDGRVGKDDFLRGHIPGAQFISLDQELSGTPGRGGRHPLPDDDELIEVFRTYGISRDSIIICYDQAEGMAAARCWALLGHLGHARTYILRGGLRAWEAADLPVEMGAVDVPVRGDLTQLPPKVQILDKPTFERLAHERVVLDARGRARYRGEVEPIDHTAGHIPGAYSLPLEYFVDDVKRPMAADQWRQRLLRESVPIDADIPYVTYCGSGVSAALLMAGLMEAGFERGAMYIGSWSEWIEDPHSPIATGDEREEIN
ncbi:MAG: sulfurtransferase [Acidimicrobiales bacterium]